MNKHRTRLVAVKRAKIDIGMIPFIRWLTSFNQAYSYYCCEGDDIAQPYVTWTCNNNIELIKILHALFGYSETTVSYCNAIGLIRYVTRFNSVESFKDFIEWNKLT